MGFEKEGLSNMISNKDKLQLLEEFMTDDDEFNSKLIEAHQAAEETLLTIVEFFDKHERLIEEFEKQRSATIYAIEQLIYRLLDTPEATKLRFLENERDRLVEDISHKESDLHSLLGRKWDRYFNKLVSGNELWNSRWDLLRAWEILRQAKHAHARFDDEIDLSTKQFDENLERKAVDSIDFVARALEGKKIESDDDILDHFHLLCFGGGEFKIAGARRDGEKGMRLQVEGMEELESLTEVVKRKMASREVVRGFIEHMEEGENE